MATEFVEPLNTHLGNISKDSRERDLYLSWGIFQVTVRINKCDYIHARTNEFELVILFQRALSFLNNDGNLRHNNVCMSSIFVNQAGEWKLGSVEHMAGLNEGEGVPIKILPALEKYSPPEKADIMKQRHITKWSDVHMMSLNSAFIFI